MKILYVSLFVFAAIVTLIFAAAFVCYLLAFYSPGRRAESKEEYPIPNGEAYRPYREQMIDWIKKMRIQPCEEIETTSFDGLKLRGKYYHGADNGIIEIMFHGYRSTGERDMCGGIQRAFDVSHNVMLVDQRACGRSDGHTITFGIKERYDVLSWVNFAIEKFGADCKIMLTGISLGGATVMMASEFDLPENVIAVLEDCGYSSPKAIIKHVIGQMKLPANLVYPFVKMGGRVFGRFNLEESSAVEAVEHCRIPIIFYHGENDGFVPCEMCRQCYDACTAPKKIYTVPNADHGLSYLVDNDGYMKALTSFEREYLND